MKECKFNCDIVQLSKQSEIESNIYHVQILNFLKKLKREYPEFNGWYKQLYVNNMKLKENREILICKVNNSIAGVSILKSDLNEKKICTFRVKEEFQGNGIGKKLMEKSFEYLDTDKPLITIHKSKQKQFEKMFKYFNFELEQENKNYYKLFNIELAYNGQLPKKEIWLKELQIVNFEKYILNMFHRRNNNLQENMDYILHDYLKYYKF